MPYTDLICQESEYNYSANIQFDTENDHKLGRFIPNETTAGLIREYFVDITREKPIHHSRILYGSYGTGKSHFLTVLSLLLGKTHVDGGGYKEFIKRIYEMDANLASDIDSFISDDSRKPFLVVPVVFDFEDFDRCLYFSLKKKLESIGNHISFKIFFDQALDLLCQWKQHEESYERLSKACANAKTTIADLEQKLQLLEENAEPIFQRVFGDMTFGVKFVYEVENISDSIDYANKALKDNYSGIVFIFDEFGRYIEDNIKKIKVKRVQNIAEFCDHCDGNNHIILVSHKEISQYTQRQGKAIANEWKKVEGRYTATSINDKQDQCLSLIQSILKKNTDTWNEFKSQYGQELNSMYAEAVDFKGFLIDTARGENPLEGGFPLHPISLYALDRLSKKVAQNERTFFTYLASKDDNSLYRFLIQTELDEFHFVGIDEIYDYFEPSIKSFQSGTEYDWYKKLQTALAKNHMSGGEGQPEEKILKVITTIGIINDANTLRANKATLLSVIDCPKEILSNALVGLCEQRIIKYSGSYDRYEFYDASIFDVEAMIEEKSHEIKDEAVVNTLNESFVDFALYPYSYNRNYKITRVFAPVYATQSTISSAVVLKKLGPYYDGVLVMLFADADTELTELFALSNDIDRSIVLANRDSAQLKNAVKKYVAVQFYKSQKAEFVKKDPFFEKELQYFERELSTAILSRVHSWACDYRIDIDVIVGGEVLADITSLSELSVIASEICANIYSNTLIVNNELVNKNNVSGSISTAKKNAIGGILRGANARDYYDVVYLSPDYIAVRSVLAKNGFIPEICLEVAQNELPDGTCPQNFVRTVINRYIQRAKSETVSFAEVYSSLKAPPYGLRDGYLSLLLAHVLAPYKKSLIITSHDVEQELTVDLFEEIIRRPVDYTFTIASWSAEQIDYLDAIEQIFASYINTATISRNRLKAIYDAMLANYKSISKFSRTTKAYVSPVAQNYRKLMEKTSTNYSKFFFKHMRELGGSYAETIDIVKSVKAELEGCLGTLANDLSIEISKMFTVSTVMPLSELFSERYQDSWQAKRQKSFDYYTNSFLEFASHVNVQECDYDIVLRLAKAITGLELTYWSDSHKTEFIERLREVKKALDAYSPSKGLSEHEAKMTIVTSRGKEKSIVFDKNELDARGKTIKNKINATFGNYGLSISYDDKVQILLSLIEDLLEGK